MGRAVIWAGRAAASYKRAFLALVLCFSASHSAAETWAERKCATFAEAWQSATPAQGSKAPSLAFRSKVEAFIASGCEAPRDACPESAADVALADSLALIVALEGMSTTFLPISCPTP
ncbi:MAG: hypothetical protein WAT25_17045 [Paracoccaceae bacterium]